MSGEMIAIVAVGVALAGVILTSLKGTETRLREDMKQLSESVARVKHSQAKLKDEASEDPNIDKETYVLCSNSVGPSSFDGWPYGRGIGEGGRS